MKQATGVSALVGKLEKWWAWAYIGGRIDLASALDDAICQIRENHPDTSMVPCTECGLLYKPYRRPATGRRHYCETCRKAGVPIRDAQRAARLRAKSAR